MLLDLPFLGFPRRLHKLIHWEAVNLDLPTLREKHNIRFYLDVCTFLAHLKFCLVTATPVKRCRLNAFRDFKPTLPGFFT